MTDETTPNAWRTKYEDLVSATAWVLQHSTFHECGNVGCGCDSERYWRHRRTWDEFHRRETGP